MRYRFIALLLLPVLPLTSALAAPIPEPSVILDIGPPRKGETAEKYCKTEIERLLHLCTTHARRDSEMKKPSIAQAKGSWLKNNLQIKEEDGGRRLRLTFRSGSREDQVIILNATVRAYIRLVATDRIKLHEKSIKKNEEAIQELEQIIASGKDADNVDTYRKGINNLRNIEIPANRAEIARLKQVAVIKWAR